MLNNCITNEQPILRRGQIFSHQMKTVTLLSSVFSKTEWALTIKSSSSLAEILTCITCHSPAQSLQWLPISLWIKSDIPTWPSQSYKIWPPLSLWTHLLALSLFYSFKPYQPPCCSSNTFLPQDLCTCCYLHLKCSALRSLQGFILTSFRSLLKYHL